MALVAGATCPAFAQPPAAASVIDREYAIKAAFLFQFSNYVTWPTSVFPADGKPFVIGVFGSDPFDGALEKIAARKTVLGQAIDVRLVATIPEALACQILFVPRSVPARVELAVITATIGRPVLVVGETNGFVERGGSVQFFVEHNKVRFALGANSHVRDDLEVSPKLLTLAKLIPAR